MLQTIDITDEDALSFNLVEAQHALRNRLGQDNARSLLVLVGGIEFAGKSQAVKQLREWVDPKFLYVKADTPNILNDKQPFWQPYNQFIPGQGKMMLMYGNWYTDLLISALRDHASMSAERFAQHVQEMHQFEKDLYHNGVDIIKIWFDLPWKELQKKLKEVDLSESALKKVTTMNLENLPSINLKDRKTFDTIQNLRRQFTDDWFVINETSNRKRNLIFGNHILQALQKALAFSANHATPPWTPVAIHPALREPSKTETDFDTYKKKIKRLTKKVAEVLRHDERRIVLLFEGMDAAGKGGAIKRIINALDPREYNIHAVASPQAYEKERPYLWRFWNKFNNDCAIMIFDRSWYGRVLVERVEGFAHPDEWQRAYEEINRFEKSLCDNNTVVIKFWLSISADEQLARFQAREDTPHKRYKITDEDWRNRKKWDDYLQSASDMFAKTDTAHAPWHIISTDDKLMARIDILDAIVKTLR